MCVNTLCGYSLKNVIFSNNNPFAAELFISIFHLFEAGIANAISQLQITENIIFLTKRHYRKLIVPTTNYCINFGGNIFFYEIFLKP